MWYDLIYSSEKFDKDTFLKMQFVKYNVESIIRNSDLRGTNL